MLKTLKYSWLFFFLSLLVLATTSCGKKNTQRTKLTFTLGMFVGDTFNGGGVVYGQHQATGQKFQVAFNQGDVSIDLPLGSWVINAVGWEGAAALYGPEKCVSQPINVQEGEGVQTFSFNLTASRCSYPTLGAPLFFDSIVTQQFKPISIIKCTSLPGSFGVGNECDGSPGNAQSVKITLLERDLQDPMSPGFMESSIYRCVETASTKNDISDLRLPVGLDRFGVAYLIETYYSTGCTGNVLGNPAIFGLIDSMNMNPKMRVAGNATHTLLYVADDFSAPPVGPPTSGMVMWLDGADSSTLWQDAGRSAAATVANDTIYYWDDKSGNANHATGAGGISLGVDGNSNLVPYFDGVDDVFTVADNANIDGGTEFTAVVYAVRDVAAACCHSMLYKHDSIVTRTIDLYTGASGAAIFASEDVTGSTGTLVNGGGGVQNTAYSFIAVKRDATPGVAIYRDGSEIGNSAAAAQGVYDSTGSLFIGGNETVSNFWSGYIHEVMWYNRALSQAEITQIQTYLNSKY